MGFSPGIGLGITNIKPSSGLEGLNKIFSDYGFLNMWSSENINIDGTNTTLIDYAGEHDLVNPSAVAQPTYTASDINFNNLPSLSFDGINNYVRKLTPNWRASDNSGVMIAVVKANATTYGFLCTADNASNSFWMTMYQNTSSQIGFIRNGAAQSISLTSDNTAKVSAIAGTGSVYKIFLNGVDDTDTSGTYYWLDNFPTQRDDIAIGAATRSSTIYSDFTWVLSGYLPYVDDSTIINLQNELKTYYGI